VHAVSSKKSEETTPGVAERVDCVSSRSTGMAKWVGGGLAWVNQMGIGGNKTL